MTYPFCRADYRSTAVSRGGAAITLDEEMDGTKWQQLPVKNSGHSPKPSNDCPIAIMVLLWSILVCSIGGLVYGFMAGMDDTPDPRLFVRLVAAQGLGADAPCAPPVLELAVDVDRIPEEALYRGPIDVGGEGAMLRVSYRGVILAWGALPQFTIDVRVLGRCAAGVATVVARSEGSIVRQEMRNMIIAEQQAFGRAEFDVDGELPSLGGHLHCKAYLFQGEVTEAPPPCWVEKKRNH